MTNKIKLTLISLLIVSSSTWASTANIIRLQAPITLATEHHAPSPEPEQPQGFEFSGNSLPAGIRGDSYAYNLNALINQKTPSGGITWAAANLPAGLSLDNSTGIISGEPRTEGLNSFSATASEGAISKSQAFYLNVAPNVGTFTMQADVGSKSGSGFSITAVGSYRTDVYGVSIGNIIRDEHGHRIMAYMHTNNGGGCYAGVGNVTGDGYSASAGAPTAESKAWVTKYKTMTFNTADGAYATFSNGAVQSYYNGWYRQYTTSCTLYNTWKNNPGLIKSVTFQ